MEKFNLTIDSQACWGCKTCEVACKQENNPPNGVKLIHIYEEEPKTINGKLVFLFQSRRCHHCDEPECVQACPEESIRKREDGIVVLDNESCSGCEICIDACPYDAICFDETRGIAQKCNLCYERVDQGLIPACADNVCLAHCIHFS